MTVIADLRTLLRFPGFRRLLTVRLLSQFADGMFQVGLATYVVFSPEEETTARDIAAAMAVLLLPYSLLGPFAGVLLDRWRRRQVLFYGNLLRTVLAALTCALVLQDMPRWVFYLSALSVTAVNRFILAGLSAALPHVVDADRLVVANSLSPTAGTVAASAGGSAAFGAQLLAGSPGAEDAITLALAGLVYLLAGLSTLTMARELLGPDQTEVRLRLGTALLDTAQGLLAGLRHLVSRPIAAWVVTGIGLMRFCYGALLVTVLMLARHAWTKGTADGNDGVAMLGLVVGVSAAGFLAAAVVTPAAVSRLGRLGWFAACAAVAAMLVPPLGLPFQPLPTLIAALLLGLITQSTKIVTDTVVQATIEDGYRGRVFSVYDMVFNMAFVGAAVLAALMLPPDGRSAPLVLTVAVGYAVTAAAIYRVSRETEHGRHPAVSSEPPTSP